MNIYLYAFFWIQIVLIIEKCVHKLKQNKLSTALFPLVLLYFIFPNIEMSELIERHFEFLFIQTFITWLLSLSSPFLITGTYSGIVNKARYTGCFFSSTNTNITTTRKVINTILIGLNHFEEETHCYKMVKAE